MERHIVKRPAGNTTPQLDTELMEKASSPVFSDSSTDSLREFQVPLHYPKYTRVDYDSMSEPLLDRLLEAYGLPTTDQTLEAKRNTAIRTFLWEVHRKDDKVGEVEGQPLLRRLSSLCRQLILGEEP